MLNIFNPPAFMLMDGVSAQIMFISIFIPYFLYWSIVVFSTLLCILGDRIKRPVSIILERIEGSPHGMFTLIASLLAAISAFIGGPNLR